MAVSIADAGCRCWHMCHVTPSVPPLSNCC
jgi:hypothetical protein